MTELDDSRRANDRFFEQHPYSPLTAEQKRGFDGLKYFPEDPGLRLLLQLNTDVAHDGFDMETSTGDKRHYRREGSITFRVDGQEASLYLYSSEGQHELFLPFRDATSGKESYGGGRYLETILSNDGTVLVDFNIAYNPYCAYNESWSCPIPPIENWLTVPIRAGEMAWH
ncbi:MAG: DUF1684 domain-containing protein [Dehalococcoidia bacterium]|nr:DUF1684 domain-containing protein [Dehalococcoidia bacterium]